MKILYIGNFYDNTGWSKHCVDCVLALDSVGVDVVPRTLKLNNTIGEVPERLVELESKSDKNPDIVIQNVLPHLSKYFGNIKNIIHYQTETSNFKKIRWQDHINLMDQAWVFSQYSKNASLKSGVTIPVEVIPMPVDIKKFDQKYGEVENLKNNVEDNSFIFYTISEFTSRKNIETILKAYHSEFDATEPVYLLIKSSSIDQDSQNKLSQMIDGIKRDLKIYGDIKRYKKELMIFGQIPEVEIYKIHESCDCFVSASRAEGWCLPAFDAMGFGNIVVAPRHTSFIDYLNDKNAYLVDSYEDVCFGANDTLPQLYSASENWYNISVLSLRQQMRKAYEQRKGEGAKKALQAKNDIQKYNYEKVGKIMKQYLKEIV